ncbi:hypothetical protein MPER_09378, partial [Moniliophthora perniciosa FA553]
HCGSGRCACFWARRECDPNVCVKCKSKVADPSLCRNVSLQRGVKKNLQVKDTELIVEYVGELIYETTIDSRDDAISIDSFYAGNESRYINHSEENANCTAIVKLVNGEHRIGIYAAKNILAGEELFLNYGPIFFKDYSVGDFDANIDTKRSM